jgi:hypothetical protein
MVGMHIIDAFDLGRGDAQTEEHRDVPLAAYEGCH